MSRGNQDWGVCTSHLSNDTHFTASSPSPPCFENKTIPSAPGTCFPPPGLKVSVQMSDYEQTNNCRAHSDIWMPVPALRKKKKKKAGNHWVPPTLLKSSPGRHRINRLNSTSCSLSEGAPTTSPERGETLAL